MLMDVGDMMGLDQLLDKGLQLIPQMQIAALRRADQQQQVSLISQTACLAASVALETRKDPIDALDRLEKGRMMNFGSIIDQREENILLETERPQMHAELTRLQNLLQLHAHEEDDSSKASQPKMVQHAKVRLDAAHKINILIKEIRQVPGLEGFRTSPSRAEYQSAARLGPVIVLNPTKLRCDAIIIQESKIEVFHLRKVSLLDPKDQAEKLQSALSNAARASGLRRRHATGQANFALEKGLEWLWITVVEPLLSHLGFIVQCPSIKLPRIWWVCCDVFSAFPIHAAGYHSTQDADNVMKYCISSYTTSTKALIFARKQSHTPSVNRSTSSKSLLVIPMPSTPSRYPGQLSDLDTASEISSIQRHTPPSWAPISTLTNPTCDSVLEHLPSCRIAHFACHALSHTLDPSASRLLLSDHLTMPFTILRVGNLMLPNARLAFPSACHSAVARFEGLQNEGITITNAFQLAGFPSTIGTLWQAVDAAAVEITGRFYEILFCSKKAERKMVMKGEGEGEEEGEEWDITGEKCARALYEAIVGMKRLKPGAFIEWASWVHVGN